MAIVKSPRRSARKHSAATGLSDHSVRRILHKDLNFHPYKIAIVQELSDRDTANRRIFSEQLLEMLNDGGVISTILTHLHRVMRKLVIAFSRVVDGSRVSSFFCMASCTCVFQLLWLTYRFKVIVSLVQDAWVSSYK